VLLEEGEIPTPVLPPALGWWGGRVGAKGRRGRGRRRGRKEDEEEGWMAWMGRKDGRRRTGWSKWQKAKGDGRMTAADTAACCCCFSYQQRC